MKPRLVTKAEVREWMECDACGDRVLRRPWPAGWVQCSTSRHLIADYKREPDVLASWCPKHARGYELPTRKVSWSQLLRELRSIRETLRNDIPASALATKRDSSESSPAVDAITQEGNGPLRKTDAQGPHIRYSARREGLQPMRT